MNIAPSPPQQLFKVSKDASNNQLDHKIQTEFTFRDDNTQVKLELQLRMTHLESSFNDSDSIDIKIV